MRATRTPTPKPGRRPLKPRPEADGGDDPRTRTCIATGARGSPDGFVRFVASPDGEVAPDFSGKLPGRGAWVGASRAAVDAAAAKGAFARAFRKGVRAPDDLADRVEAGLAKAALSALGLARRAGEAVAGFEKVRAALKSGDVAALVSAADAGEDGRTRLARLARDAALVDVFAGSELSAALGRDGLVHVAVKRGPAAARFLREARRLEGFRNGAAATRSVKSARRRTDEEK